MALDSHITTGAINHGTAVVAASVTRAAKVAPAENQSSPLALLKEAGFADATPVRILYGEEGRRRCIQLVSDPEGKFRLSPRKAVSLLQAPELTPKAKIDKKQSLAHSEPGGGKIIFDLPAGWDLARKDVLA